MQTRTLIKDTATVARVTELTEGDTYRRLIPKSTYESTKIAVGVVTGVLNNGESLAITALEVKEGYGSEVEVKVFDADQDLALFPADHTEVLEILGSAQNYQRSAVERAEKALGEARDKEDRLNKVVRLIDLAQRADQLASGAPAPSADQITDDQA